MFQTRLKQLRERENLSQVKLAALLGVSQSTVGMWESGRNKPTFSMLNKIAKVFSVPVGSLVEESVVRVLASDTAGYTTASTVTMPDDSMAPDIQLGDLLTLRTITAVNRGDIVAFAKDGHVYVRHITLNGDAVAATARDIELPPVVFSRGKEKESGIQLLGKVIALQRSYR